jgi:hypothetical protein
MSTRLSVNINDETADALRTLAERRGVTVTETIRRAVSVYKYLADEMAEGRVLQVTDGREVTQVRLL